MSLFLFTHQLQNNTSFLGLYKQSGGFFYCTKYSTEILNSELQNHLRTQQRSIEGERGHERKNVGQQPGRMGAAGVYACMPLVPFVFTALMV